MLLAIDIGNTNITLGVFDGDKLRNTWRLATDVHRMPDEYAATLLKLLEFQKLQITDIKEASLSTVVPPLLGPFRELLERYFNISPLVVGAGVKTGVNIRMDNPKEVGTDRIVNAAAAHYLYGGPVIIVCFGTATVFDTVSKEGNYIGGAIAPGINIAAEALFTRTAALPRVALTRPAKAIGTNTIAAMQSGLLFGYVGLVEGLVGRIQKELDQKATVVASGGLSSVIARETTIFDKVNPELTLIGLKLIYQMNKT